MNLQKICRQRLQDQQPYLYKTLTPEIDRLILLDQDLFQLPFYLYKTLTPEIDRLILLDIDTKVFHDIGELYDYVDQFSTEEMIGMVPELTPWFRMILRKYRSHHPQTPLETNDRNGRMQGFNSGVCLFDFQKMREQRLLEDIITKELFLCRIFCLALNFIEKQTLTLFDLNPLYFNSLFLHFFKFIFNLQYFL